MFGLYSKAMFKVWLERHEEHRYALENAPNFHYILKNAKNIQQFDLMYTIHHFQHNSLDSYYEHSSSKNYISGIKTPTLFINFEDDPICDKQGIPTE